MKYKKDTKSKPRPTVVTPREGLNLVEEKPERLEP
jgi:hypothetical protein